MNWDSFKWRNHQPDIGRFFNVDPLATKYVYNSPYAFSENHVTSHVELEGLEKVDFMVARFKPGQTEFRSPEQAASNPSKPRNTNFSEVSEYHSKESLVFTVDLQNGDNSIKSARDQDKNFISAGIDALNGDVEKLDFNLKVQATKDGFTISGDIDGAGFSINGNVNDSKINLTTQMTNMSEGDGGAIKMYGGNDYFYSPTVIGTKQGSDCFFCGSGNSSKQSSSVPYTTDSKGNAVIDPNYQKKNEDENHKKSTTGD